MKTLFDYTNTGISERNKSFKEICLSGDKQTQEQQYLILLTSEQGRNGLTDSEANILLGLAKSERVGARRNGLMKKHEDCFKSSYGASYKNFFYPLFIKVGSRENLFTNKKNSVWALNHNKLKEGELF